MEEMLRDPSFRDQLIESITSSDNPQTAADQDLLQNALRAKRESDLRNVLEEKVSIT